MRPETCQTNDKSNSHVMSCKFLFKMCKVKTDVSSGNPKSQGIISVITATRLRFKRWFDPIFHHSICFLLKVKNMSFSSQLAQCPGTPREIYYRL